jgi:hypothetical protein
MTRKPAPLGRLQIGGEKNRYPFSGATQAHLRPGACRGHIFRRLESITSEFCALRKHDYSAYYCALESISCDILLDIPFFSESFVFNEIGNLAMIGNHSSY